MTRNIMPDDLNTANGWFFGRYAVEIYRDFNKINNSDEYKVTLVGRVFNETKRDSKLSGTLTRINAVLRIIEDNQFEYCLQYVAKSKHIGRIDVLSAIDALAKLRNGTLIQNPLNQ